MKSRIVFGKIIFSLFILSALIFSPSAWSQQSQCNYVTDRLSVLTLNLLFSEVPTREARLSAIAEFIGDHPIDIILLQEVVGGSLAKTGNSSVDLQRLLAQQGLHYNLAYTMANGIPGILSVGNAILSRCEILTQLSWTLPFESEEVFDDFEVPLKRKVLMARVKVPSFGKLHVYDTHLCSNCSAEGRLQQASVLMNFIKNVEYLFPGSNPIVLGGDFNTDLNFPDNHPVYQLILAGGFTDTYDYVNNCGSCCTKTVDNGCTFAVDSNPYAVDLFTHEKEIQQRIDYIFVKGVSGIENSMVIFDPPFVSDHSGVVSTIRLK